ncbi:alpha/beta hydrolase-fold protein [Flavivirga abyssicola]|uniref:alpha/beta hydrolase-fold protein n=1 Tax=Flavivirga abyssicola TaxID=3063533 RepID=UPI0026DF7DE7|nr:alpha/beta hydrolase-fold protein [Flavivirga sp. MEBiC07777]WVK12412.1 alpha/beta hydrolase-fold protein [Flavivirga sp. MEBiC07777]
MKKTSIKIKNQVSLTCILFLLISSAFLNAQNMPGESFTIQSKYMKGDRKIQIALPHGYNEWTEYDVQYMLDPKWNMELRKSLLDFMQNKSMSPRTILVGVVSPDRTSDMTPTKMDNFPTSGNAENFIDFIGKEVKPFVESKYKTSGHNTFAGHSFGGLCVMHALLKSPEYFDSYLVSDPSFWYDNEFLVKMAKEKLSKVGGKTLFIGGRKGKAYKSMGIKAMEAVLKEYAPDNLDWKITAYEDETHNSVVYKLNYDGIKFISQDFRNSTIKFTPNQGEVIPGIPLAIFMTQPNDKLRYTIDGSEPDFDSEFMNDSITILKATTLKVKIPLKRDRTLPAVSGEFVEGKKLKGIKKGKKHVSGLHYTYYEGHFNKLPNFDTLNIIKTGLATKGFKLKSFPKKQFFASVYKGYFEAKTSGYHYFVLSSDDGLKFYIHNKLMINNDLKHKARSQKSTVIYLEKGLHPIRYEYFQFDAGAEINLYYKAPGETPGKLNFDRFWHKPSRK